MGRETPRVEPLEDAQTKGSGHPDPGSAAARNCSSFGFAAGAVMDRPRQKDSRDVLGASVR
eukprot:345362-Amphidinium_carterae.1